METTAALFELASVSLACRDQETLLKTFAARVGASAGAKAVLVWLTNGDEGLTCRARWNEPGERVNPAEGVAANGLLSEVLESGETRRLGAKQISPKQLSHLDESSRGRVRSALYTARAEWRRF